MSKKVKNKTRNPPLSALDKFIYFLGLAFSLVLVSLFIILLLQIKDYIAFSNEFIVAYSSKASLFWAFPFLIFILFHWSFPKILFFVPTFTSIHLNDKNSSWYYWWTIIIISWIRTRWFYYFSKIISWKLIWTITTCWFIIFFINDNIICSTLESPPFCYIL